MSDRLTGDFRKFMDKSFLGAWDVPDGGDLVLTIDHAERNEVKNDRGSEKKLVLHFRERDYKPMILNTTNAKAISKAYGTTKVDEWENKPIGIYKATISAFGQTTECLRVREYPPKTDTLICEDCGDPITDTVIDGKKYRAKVIAERSVSLYNKKLCYVCAKAREVMGDDTDA